MRVFDEGARSGAHSIDCDKHTGYFGYTWKSFFLRIRCERGYGNQAAYAGKTSSSSVKNSRNTSSSLRSISSMVPKKRAFP